MLFDEPTSALDPEMLKEVIDVMVSLADDGMDVVCVTHEMNFARQERTASCPWTQGQIVEIGTPAELFGAPKHERSKRPLQQVVH